MKPLQQKTDLIAPAFCAQCGDEIESQCCSCEDGPKVWVMPIPPEWEDYFFMDGTVKPKLKKLKKKVLTIH